MNIKSLLLGSAAAMVAVSGAQAADAVVVEPEPVEYVRVCDAYGSGFFYIPGTETCLKFSGYIRSVWRSNSTSVGGAESNSAEDWLNRGRVIVTANSETDWGTLSGLFRFDATNEGKTSGSDVGMNRALISLAGFRVGLGANYWTTNHGFANLDFEGVNGEDGYYFGSTTSASLFDYTWAADGLAITVGVQNTSNDINAVSGALNTSPYDLYAGFNYSADFGSIAATWIQDSDGGQAGVTDSGSAWKVSATFDISEVVPGGVLHAMYLTDGDDKTEYVSGGTFGTASTESMWSVGAQMDLSDELVLAAHYYDVSEDTAGGGQDGSLIGVGLTWRPAAAPGLKVYGTYKKSDFDTGGAQTEVDGFALAIRRSF